MFVSFNGLDRSLCRSAAAGGIRIHTDRYGLRGRRRLFAGRDFLCVGTPSASSRDLAYICFGGKHFSLSRHSNLCRAVCCEFIIGKRFALFHFFYFLICKQRISRNNPNPITLSDSLLDIFSRRLCISERSAFMRR